MPKWVPGIIKYPAQKYYTSSSINRSAVRYSIVGGNEDSAFSINPGSGVIATRGGHGGPGPLDFERARFYNLTVEAAALGKRDRCTVHVHVIDVNDNAPVFEKRCDM